MRYTSNKALQVAAVLIGLAAILALGAAALMIVTEFRRSTVFRNNLPDLPEIRSASSSTAIRFPDKIWAHRVDSVERARQLAEDYSGLEIDVVYDAERNYFDIGHPPLPSAGISLEDIFLAVADVRNHYFWLDFKNLEAANQAASCSLLVSIAHKFDVTSHIVVESPNPEALACFGDHGLYTSYYLFSELDDDESVTREQLVDFYHQVRSKLQTARVDAVSADYRYLPFIEKFVPAKDILTWCLVPAGPRYYALLGSLRMNPRVKVVLVSQPGPGYR